MTPSPDREARRGALAAAVSYAWWGLFPLYFTAVSAVPALEMVAHRIVWSLVFVLGLLGVQRHWSWLGQALRSPRVLGIFAASALTLALNWFIYIWAVHHGHVIEGSLGYFINPLVNVVVGAAVLRERLRPAQWTAIAIATLGVVWLTWSAGRLPWIALALALSFCAYGLQRKFAPLGALEGLTLETVVLAPGALVALWWWTTTGAAAYTQVPPGTLALVLAAGPITAIPLLFFAYGARRIPFSLLGVLQYIGPTLQLLCGVWLLQEPFEGPRVWGFAAIWLALAVYSADGWLTARRA